MLSCVAAVAIATFVGKKAYEPSLNESSDLLKQNVEALTQGNEEPYPEERKKTIVADTPLQTANTMESVGVHSFSQYNGKIRYIKPLDNVIYSPTSNDEFEISTTQQVFSEKELSEIKDFSINTYATNMANNIFCGFSDIFETEKYIILSLKNLEYTVIDKQLSTCRRYSYKIDSEDTNLPLYEIACSNSNILVGILTPMEIQHLKENAKNSLVSRAINRLNVSDILSTNRIVIFYET